LVGSVRQQLPAAASRTSRSSWPTTQHSRQRESARRLRITIQGRPPMCRTRRAVARLRAAARFITGSSSDYVRSRKTADRAADRAIGPLQVRRGVAVGHISPRRSARRIERERNRTRKVVRDAFFAVTAAAPWLDEIMSMISSGRHRGGWQKVRRGGFTPSSTPVSIPAHLHRRQSFRALDNIRELGKAGSAITWGAQGGGARA